VHLISRLNARQHDFEHGIKYLFELHDQHSESMNFTLLHDFARFCIHFFFQFQCCMIFLMHDKSTKLCIRRMLHDYAECIQQIRTLLSRYHFTMRWAADAEKAAPPFPFLSFLHAPLWHISLNETFTLCI
jgi:hypothetical protein